MTLEMETYATMSQVRIVKEDGSDTTYHNCTGVTSSRNGSPVTSITVQWKSDAQGVPFVEKRIPDDGQVIYVMDDRGHTMNTYRLPAGAPSLSPSSTYTDIAHMVAGEVSHA